jgi:hypothetical protein
MGSSGISHLQHLIVNDRIDEAVDHASKLSADYIGSLLDFDRIEEAPEQHDRFIRSLVASVDGEFSAYRKVDLVIHLADLYVTALSYLPNAFFADRDLSLAAAGAVAERLQKDLEAMDLLVGCPDRVLPAATQARFNSYAAQLAGMDLSIRDDESRPHEATVLKDFRRIGEDTDAWLILYRENSMQPKDPAGRTNDG